MEVLPGERPGVSQPAPPVPGAPGALEQALLKGAQLGCGDRIEALQSSALIFS